MLRRRLILLSALLAVAAGLALAFWQSNAVLSLARAHPVVIRAYPARLAASASGPGLLSACGWMDESARSAETRGRLSAIAEEGREGPVDLGLGPGDPSPELPGAAEAGTVELPAHASALLATADQPLLLAHASDPRAFAEAARRRGWLGPLVAEVAAGARSVSVLATETAAPPTLRITVAMEFSDGAEAESALRRLTDAQGDLTRLGLVAQPGYERIVRRTRLVVIRLEVEASLARSRLRTR